MAKTPFLQAIKTPGFSRKLTMAFALVIAVVALTIPVAFYAFAHVRTASNRATASWETLQQVNEFQQALDDMRVMARDYAATGSNADRDAVLTQLNVMNDKVRCIQSGCGNDLASRYMPDSERGQWHTLIDKTAIAHERFRRSLKQGHPERAVRAFDDGLQQDVGTTAARLAQAVRDRGKKAQEDIYTAIAASASLLLFVLAAALLVATALAWWIPRSLMRRLDNLRRSAAMLASGDLSARANEERIGTDEMADLIMDFNTMARSLQTRQDENLLLQQQLQVALLSEQERSTRDPLTSLRNHRYFQESLAAELDRAQRSKRKVSIAVIDLDDFKKVNDNFGHHEGDAVLLRVTKGISDNLRPYDLACRLGGEEFGIIFPETDAEEAQLVLQRIAQHVVGFGPQGGRATFSAGISTFPTHASAQTELFQLADEAVYHSKGAGKNQSTIYDKALVSSMNSDARQRQKAREAVLTTAMTLVSAVDTKDPYTRNHSELTAMYAATLARALHLDEEQVKLVYRAALLHDVGKIGVADEVLRKPGKLTPDEWAQIRMHPDFSFRILESAEMGPVAMWARHHHEHWDGSGYPLGISGEEIPLGSRIILVADAFEAMTSDRVYRRSLGLQQALGELASCAGTQFDPRVAEMMITLVTNGVFNQIHQQYGKELMPIAAPAMAPPLRPAGIGAPPSHLPGQQISGSDQRFPPQAA